MTSEPDKFKDRIFRIPYMNFARTNGLKASIKEYVGAAVDVRYTENTYGVYMAQVSVIFETPEDHCAFRLKHGHKFL